MTNRDNSRFYRHLLAGSCLAAMAVLAQPAFAQAAQAEGESDNPLGDIVVTARYVK